MYPDLNKPTNKSLSTSDVVNHEDIDLFWDNPEKLKGRREDILDIIQREVSNRGKAPPLEWHEPEPPN